MTERPREAFRGVSGAPARGTSALSGRLVFGLAVLTFGVLITLDNLDLIRSGDVIRWWGAVPLAWGVAQMLGWAGSSSRLGGAPWVVIGAVSLLHALDVLPVSVFDLWPLVLVYVGANLVFRSWRGGERSWASGKFTEPGDQIQTFALMSANEHKVVSQAFRGGSADAVMGGVTVDLRSAALAEGRARLDLFAMWAGIEIVVPRGWRVTSEVTPVMGGFEDSTEQPSDSGAPQLVLRGFVVMGGIEVKHVRDEDRESGGVVVKVGVGGGSSRSDAPPRGTPPVEPE